jgi:predicted RNase H-like HicB family nuclease
MRYAVVIEKAGSNFSAYVPDLPGCVATGNSVEAVEREIREAIRFHIDGLNEDGLPIPAPTSIAITSKPDETGYCPFSMRSARLRWLRSSRSVAPPR